MEQDAVGVEQQIVDRSVNEPTAKKFMQLMKSYEEMNPGLEMLKMMRQRGIPVVVGSDSHRPSRVAVSSAMRGISAARSSSV